MKSTQKKIRQCEGLGTNALTEWQNGFVQTLVDTPEDKPDHQFSDKQIEHLDRIHRSHFA
jgi:hypothetical protein